MSDGEKYLKGVICVTCWTLGFTFVSFYSGALAIGIAFLLVAHHLSK